MQIFIKVHPEEFLLSVHNLISVWATRSRPHGTINLISSCNYFIVLRKWPHCHQVVDYWQLQAYSLLILRVSATSLHSHKHTHTQCCRYSVSLSAELVFTVEIISCNWALCGNDLASFSPFSLWIGEGKSSLTWNTEDVLGFYGNCLAQ